VGYRKTAKRATDERAPGRVQVVVFEIFREAVVLRSRHRFTRTEACLRTRGNRPETASERRQPCDDPAATSRSSHRRSVSWAAIAPGLDERQLLILQVAGEAWDRKEQARQGLQQHGLTASRALDIDFDY
jgi:hypothetical protein